MLLCFKKAGAEFQIVLVAFRGRTRPQTLEQGQRAPLWGHTALPTTCPRQREMETMFCPLQGLAPPGRDRTKRSVPLNPDRMAADSFLRASLKPR